MTTAIFTAISILTKPVGESVRDAQVSQQEVSQQEVSQQEVSQEEVLLRALQANRLLLLQRLQSDQALEEVRRLREEAPWFSHHTHDPSWAFVQECLVLLSALTRHISSELELFKRRLAPPTCARTPEVAPPLPPDVLSVSQQKTLGAALQFVVVLGLCPYLAPGVGVPLGQRSAFGAMVEKVIHGDRSQGCGRRLLTTTNVLLQMAEVSSLATPLFTRHLGDMMAALSQLGFQPHRADEGGAEETEVNVQERSSCRDALRCILGKVYQPIVVKELLILQGATQQSGPAGLGSAAGGSSRPGLGSAAGGSSRPGLGSAAGGSSRPGLGSAAGGSSRPGLGSAAGGSSRPGLGSAPVWLRRLCGQFLSERLMQPHGVHAVVRAVLEGVSGDVPDWRKCEVVSRILVTCPQQCVCEDSYYRQVCPQILDLLHFKDKLTAQQFQGVATRAALLMLQEKPQLAQQHLLTPLLAPLRRCSTLCDVAPSQDAVQEWELSRCVEDVYKVCVVGNTPSASVLTALEDVLPVVFTLYCFTRKSVSHLRAPCQEVLLWYLRRSLPPPAVSLLKHMSGVQLHNHRLPPHVHFTAGSDGGVRLTSRHDYSDEDEALYEKLSDEQWRLECVMDLLRELKDTDLPGRLFLDLLQGLTVWVEEEEEEEGELDVSSMTLLDLEQQRTGVAERRGHRLAVLQMLASMVESLPHTMLLRKTTQVVDFILSLLQRACVTLKTPPGPDQHPIDSQTLSMSMGLVTTVLSGPQLTSDDYRSLSRLLPPLQTLSEDHPEIFIQDLASNLSAVIATHGAYMPHDLTSASLRSQTSGPAANAASIRSQTKHQVQTHVCGSPSPDIDSTSASPGREGGGRSSGTAPAKPFSDWLLEACDPDVPTKAFALRGLTQMVQNGNPEAVQEQEKVLLLFLENLEHGDSFIYLSAIQGLAVLADSFPETILDRLLRDFQHGPSLSMSDQERSLETRLKLGEVLMRASRAMGDLAPHLGRPLVGVFLHGTKDPDPSVRTSSLSNLGELCERLDYALGPLVQELSWCVTALIKTEKEVEVRRAAVNLITLMLRGLSHKSIQVLQDVLLELYRALKWVLRSDPDQVVVVHAQLALEELDHVMKTFIFPEQRLEKKIVVLP